MGNLPEGAGVAIAREIFGPLGGVVEICAVVDGEFRVSLDRVSVGSFVRRNHAALDGILQVAQESGGFPDSTMALVDGLGWHRDHEVTAPSLLLWSGGIEEFSPALENPRSVRRMVEAGRDLQLVRLMHALVGAAVAREKSSTSLSELIIEAIRAAAGLVGMRDPGAVRDTYRMWRVAHLPAVLMPGSGCADEVWNGYRSFAHTIDRLLS
ncbi:hypothetical protein OOK13_32770 [Streptomyces sp. NBC_00378]|uniref:hypothetical protein n=1 Tax=unclassified Streptomyces TaxID=2593676 RepID=UPI00225BF057|nr:MULTISPECIES: hypothetical protein [unclassified Streptomyces]MCX5113152.1 hypothetical protein [Streptomyces sp. NBC_00378]